MMLELEPSPSPEREELLAQIQRLIVEYDCRGTDYLERLREQRDLQTRCCYGLSRVYAVLDSPGLTDKQRVMELEKLRARLGLFFPPHSLAPSLLKPEEGP